MDQRGLLKETLVVAIGEFGRSPAHGRQHVRQLQRPGRPRPLALLLQRASWRAAASRAARSTAKSDATASSPKEKPVHPNDLLATIYYALGIDPDMVMLNHLNQPRELVKGKIVADLWS